MGPALGGLFGTTDAAADSLGGVAAAGAASDLGAASAAAPTALGFAGDAVDPFSAASFAPAADVPAALSSGLSGNVLDAQATNRP